MMGGKCHRNHGQYAHAHPQAHVHMHAGTDTLSAYSCCFQSLIEICGPCKDAHTHTF